MPLKKPERSHSGVKVPILQLIKIFGQYKTGKLTLVGLVVALILAFVSATACSSPESDSCIHWSAYWEASNR